MTDFSALLEQAIQELPEEFRRKLENVAIIVEDYPSRELLSRMEVSEDETLFGLYEGVPLPERGYFDTPLHPDRILIFQREIEEHCDSADEVKNEIKITLVHEIAHFFGIDDEHLEKLGY